MLIVAIAELFCFDITGHVYNTIHHFIFLSVTICSLYRSEIIKIYIYKSLQQRTHNHLPEFSKNGYASYCGIRVNHCL